MQNHSTLALNGTATPKTCAMYNFSHDEDMRGGNEHACRTYAEKHGLTLSDSLIFHDFADSHSWLEIDDLLVSCEDAETFPAEVLLIGNTHLMDDATEFAWFMTVFAEANVKVIFVHSHVVPSKVTRSLDTSWRWWEEDLVYYWVCLQYEKSLSERTPSRHEPSAAPSLLCDVFNEAMKALLDGSWTHPDVWKVLADYVTPQHPYLVKTMYSD